MRSILLVPLLLTACAGGSLYPSQVDMNRTCPQVVSDSYKSLTEYKNKSAASTGVTFGVAGGYCLAVGIAVYVVDIILDPFGKGAASSKFNKNMQQGRDMKCTEN